MKLTRHYGKYILDAFKRLKKYGEHAQYHYVEYVWDQIDPEFELKLKISAKKKRKVP